MLKIGAQLQPTSSADSSLQFPYPKDFPDEYRSTGEGMTMLAITSLPNYFSEQELTFLKDSIKNNPKIKSKLILAGCVLIDENDPLQKYSHEQLDAYEQEHTLPSTKVAPGGGTPSVYERVLSIRETEVLSRWRS